MPEVVEPPNFQEGNYMKGKRSELSVVDEVFPYFKEKSNLQWLH